MPFTDVSGECAGPCQFSLHRPTKKAASAIAAAREDPGEDREQTFRNVHNARIGWTEAKARLFARICNAKFLHIWPSDDVSSLSSEMSFLVPMRRSLAPTVSEGVLYIIPSEEGGTRSEQTRSPSPPTADGLRPRGPFTTMHEATQSPVPWSARSMILAVDSSHDSEQSVSSLEDDTVGDELHMT